MFWLTFVVYLVMVVLYCIFVSGEKQPWANGETGKQTTTDIAEEASESNKRPYEKKEIE